MPKKIQFKLSSKTLKKNKIELFFLIFLAVLSLPVLALAQENRSYQYDQIDAQIQVNKDSTFDITERQIYNYRGEYHQGWRSIALKDISAITNVEVYDGSNNRPLVYSSKRLDKLSPNNWGKYTYYRQNGALNIEWYYDLKDTTHTWIIKYKVHGGIGFYKDHDEVYWNVFTDYSVPVLNASASVVLPKNNFTQDQETAYIYSNVDGSSQNEKKVVASSSAGGTYSFIAPYPFAPSGRFTIVAGWPKGLIEQKAFWYDWFYLNWIYFLSLLVVIVSVVYYLIYWYLTEKWHKGRGTIIPQYEPPQNLPPAMAELIAKEKITTRTWPATIIDLAVRGYVKITEEKSKILLAMNIFIIFVCIAIFLFLVLPLISLFLTTKITLPSIISAIIFSLVFFIVVRQIFLVFQRGNVDYVITKQKDYNNDPNLHDYEKRFLSALLAGGDKFSTGQNRFNSERGRKLYLNITKVTEELYKETDLDTKAYEVSLKYKKYFDFIKMGFVFIVYLAYFLAFIFVLSGQSFLLPVLVALVCVLFVWLLKKYNPRLNKEGYLLKEDWLGFKMYLETAEKYRMQNLTPDLFEKYLPYAMIFGVEKKWAKNFDSLNMQSPGWYTSSNMAGTSMANSPLTSGGFSASAFSSSFSSSFSSAFSSSGGGGGAGGGGGSGGGGGGGGGGAS